jgi:hypothetical protein
MPVTYNDALDDQLAFDACLSFVGGQVSNVRGNLLSNTQYSEGTNIDIDRFGGVVTRHGTKRELGGVLDVKWENCGTNWEDKSDLWESNPPTKLDGVTYFDTPSLEQLVAVNEQKIYKNADSVGSWTEVTGYTPASGANVEFAQLVDKLYLTDGTGNVHQFDGTTLTDLGTETSGTPTAGNPPICKYLVTHTNRLFAAGCTGANTVADELFCSSFLDAGATKWDWQDDSIRIGGSSGDPITGLAPWMGVNLVVFKERSIFNVVADPLVETASLWTIQNVDSNIGCISHRSIAQVGADIFFLAPDGIRTVRSILEGASTAVSEPISVGIQDVIDTINWNAAREQACATFWRNHYLLAVPTLSSTTNNKLIVYNTVAKAFVGTWDLDVTQFTTSAFSGDLKLAMSTESGKVMFFQDYVQPDSEVDADFQDDGVNYESCLLTRAMTFGEQFSEILPNHVELELRPALAQQVQIRSVLDNGEDTVVNQTHIDTQTAVVTLPFVLPVTIPKTVPLKNSYNMIQKGPGREVQFRVKSFGSKMHLRSIKASAYINTFAQET